jgi:hypothetical protein
MFANKTEKIVISSLGWEDGGSLWILGTPTMRINRCRLSDARWLQLFVGTGDHFSVQHFWGNDWSKMNHFELTLHSFDNPNHVLARISLKADGEAFEGDSQLWDEVPSVYVGPLKGHYYVFIVHCSARKVERQQLDWFEKQYDTDYQTIGPALEVPHSHFILLPIQRSTRLVLYDLRAAKIVREIDLGGMPYKPGTPEIAFSSDGKILYALNYDTLVQLDRSDWHVLRSLPLTNQEPGESMKFVGSLSFTGKEGLCVVARPFSSDVALVDIPKMQAVSHVTVGGQPIQAIMLGDGRVLARDWQTGALLTGTRPTKN